MNWQFSFMSNKTTDSGGKRPVEENDRPTLEVAANSGSEKPRSHRALALKRPKSPCALYLGKPNDPGSSSSVRPKSPSTLSPAKPSEHGSSSSVRPKSPSTLSPAKPNEHGSSSSVRPKSPSTLSPAKPNEHGSSSSIRPKSPSALNLGKPKDSRGSSSARPKSPCALSLGKPKDSRDSSSARPKSPCALYLGKPKELEGCPSARPKSPLSIARPKSPSVIERLLPPSTQDAPMSPRKLVSQHSVPDSRDINAMLARLGYVEEERPLIPGVMVRAASTDKLLSLAVDSFDHQGAICQEKTEFPRLVFLMHQWYSTSEELATIFLNLYRNSDDSLCCLTVDCQHSLQYPACLRVRYKKQVCHTVRYWISHFPVFFDLHHELSGAVQQLQEWIREEEQEDNTELSDLIDVSKVPSFDWMRNMSVRNPSRLVKSKAKVNLVFQTLNPDELAEQLTYLEYKAFRRITFDDFKAYATHACLKENPKLERSVALFNGLSQWIQCMVLSKTTPQQRADVIVKFVNVAKRLRELQNFNSLMAVVGGLTHSSLARLGKTNACLPSEQQKVLMELTELLSSSNNFSHYRRLLHDATGFRIPVLGVHLKDLILLNTALPDKFDGTLVNFRKMVQLSIIFSELMQVQGSNLPLEPNMDLVNTLRLSLDLHYTEDEIYELSLAREPRNSLSSPSTPTKPVVFADWVAGVTPPEPETINKHVHDMVEAVFKNYDHDRDGFISHAEFEQITGNFPFIDSFAVLDADQDGMISKGEMKAYFIRANCHALRRCFKHNFHETTFFKPTFCIHCTGLLWGIIKQGWKCKDCSINAHKHCKDLVVMECRSRAHAACHGRSSLNNGSSHRNVTMSAKRKMSQRQKRHRSSRSTQTDESGLNSVTNSPKSLSRDASAAGGATGDDDVTPTGSTTHVGPDGEFYEEQSALYDRLVKAEEARDKLLTENHKLRARVETQTDQITTLKSHIGNIRQHTVTFILDQMDTLHMQRDTEV